MTTPEFSTLHVLIVDDVRAPRRVLRRLLSEVGVTNVEEASTGGDAIRRLENDGINLVICDLNLGDMKGIEVLLKVRGDEKRKDIPFIMVTSDLDKETLLEAKAAKVSSYLLKPFSLEQLLQTLTTALENHP